MPQPPDHAGGEASQNLGLIVGSGAERLFVPDDEKPPPAREGRLVHPPLDPVGILDKTPNVEFPLDLHRQAAAAVDPEDWITGARAAAQIDVIGTEDGKTGERKAGDAPPAGSGLSCRPRRQR